MSAYIRRSWVATDAYGNQSSFLQFIYYKRASLPAIQFPSDITLACDATNTSPAVTGAPFVVESGVTYPIYPSANLCEINSAFVDDTILVCDGTRKILRTWTVIDWCLPTQFGVKSKGRNPTNQITDNQGPTLVCPANMTVNTNPFDCESDVNLPDVIVSDMCSRIASGQAQWTNLNGIITTLPAQITTFPGNNLWNRDTLLNWA